MLIEVADLDLPGAQALVRLHLGAMHDTSPPQSVHAFALDSLRSPAVTVWAAYEGEVVVGIGALLVQPGATEGEVKSMRAHPAHTGRGVGRAILRVIVAEARARGLVRLSLETGSGERFVPAHRLYLSEGFVPCGPFGAYVEDPFSRFFTLALPPVTPGSSAHPAPPAPEPADP